MTTPLARPFTVDVPPQLVEFHQPIRGFVIHNAREKPVDVFFGGTKMTIPAVHRVDPAHGETDADGEIIPGTFLVQDIYTDIPEIGDEVLTFDAARAVRHILGLSPGPDGSAALANSSYALAGLSLLPRHPPKETWKATAVAGEQRAFLASVERARDVIRGADELNAKRKAAGMEPVVMDIFELERSRSLINTYNDLVRKNVEVTMAPHAVDALTDDLELEAHLKARTMELANKVGEKRNVDKFELAKELLNDPDVRIKLQKEFKIRKRGNMPVEMGALDEAAKSGQRVDQAGLEE